METKEIKEAYSNWAKDTGVKMREHAASLYPHQQFDKGEVVLGGKSAQVFTNDRKFAYQILYKGVCYGQN